jgi:hypothetical protein
MNARYPTLAELGLQECHFDRKREIGGWREMNVTQGYGCLQLSVFAPDFLGGKMSQHSDVLMLEVIERAKALGYEAWCCDNKPKLGGVIMSKIEDPPKQVSPRHHK